MKAYEIPAKVAADGTLEVPRNFVSQLPRDRDVRIIVLVSESDDSDTEWSRLTAEQFLAGYDDADAVYDEL